MSNKFEPKSKSYFRYFIETTERRFNITRLYQKLIDNQRDSWISKSNIDSIETTRKNQLIRLCRGLIKDDIYKPKLSIRFKILNFITNLNWNNDRSYLQKEINHRLTQLSKISYLGTSELRELLSFGIRVYNERDGDVVSSVPFNILDRCVNLQEFYSDTHEIDFKFAENLNNLVVVDVRKNTNTLIHGFESYASQNERLISNIDSLKSCLFLNLQSSYLEDFKKIPENILFLNLSNSNFQKIDSITHLKNLEFLDIHSTMLTDAKGISKLKSLQVLNLSQETYINKHQKKTSIDISFFKELTELKNLSLLILGEKDFKLISKSKSIHNLLNEKILVIKESNSNNPSSNELVDILNVSERNKDKKQKRKVNFSKLKALYTYSFLLK